MSASRLQVTAAAEEAPDRLSRRQYLVTTSGNFNTQALHCTMLTMGADRILFASDYPYEDYAEAGDFMDTVPISETDRRKIAYGNARALYKL